MKIMDRSRIADQGTNLKEEKYIFDFIFTLELYIYDTRFTQTHMDNLFPPFLFFFFYFSVSTPKKISRAAIMILKKTSQDIRRESVFPSVLSV